MADILLFGAPAAGKGTQAKLIQREYGWPQIATGDIFREALEEGTEIGIRAYEEHWKHGRLAPDDMTNVLALERLRREDCAAGFVLDGYPRTVPQAEAFLEFLDETQRSLDLVVQLESPRDVLVRRATSRYICGDCGAIYSIDAPSEEEGKCDDCEGELGQRKDDREEIVIERLRVYEEETEPVLQLFKDDVVVVNSNRGGVEDVFANLKELIDSIRA